MKVVKNSGASNEERERKRERERFKNKRNIHF